MTKIRFPTILFTFIGTAVFAWLLMREGGSGIFTVFSLVGLNIFWIVAYRIIPINLDSLGWHQLFIKGKRPNFADFITAKWLAESVNTLLPVGQLGGHYLRARIIGKKNMVVNEAGATVMVDFTIGLWTQIIFTILGLTLLLTQTGQRYAGTGIFIGLLVAFIAVSTFFFSQKAGLFGFIAYGVNRVNWLLRKKKSNNLAGNALNLDRKITEIYGRKNNLFNCLSWRLAGWIAKSGENWLFLYFAGVPVSIQNAIILESISTAFRSAAFFIPGGLGVQDGSLLFIGSLLGLGPDNILALALAKRIRELAIGIPGLLWWLKIESPYRKSS
jgi:putative membrane protein